MFLSQAQVKKLRVYRRVRDGDIHYWGKFQTVEGVHVVFWGKWMGLATFGIHGSGFAGRFRTNRAWNQKQKKGFQRISMDQISALWPEFEVMMLKQYTWLKLNATVE